MLNPNAWKNVKASWLSQTKEKDGKKNLLNTSKQIMNFISEVSMIKSVIPFHWIVSVYFVIIHTCSVNLILEYNEIKTKLHPVRIYFETSTFDKCKRDSKLTFVNKISTIGGIMGFWNGFCILCSLEIVHYITLAIIRCFGCQDNDDHQEASDLVSVNCLNTFQCISFLILRNLKMNNFHHELRNRIF